MNPSVDQTLAAARVLYSECDEYSDTGQLEEASNIFRRRGRFGTTFSRPATLEFWFQDDETTGEFVRCSLKWHSGRTTVSCFGELEEPDCLALGVAGASGATTGVAHTVPALLLPEEVGGWRVTDLVSPRVVGRDTVEGADSWIVEGGNPSTDTRFTLSVGVVLPFIYRVEEHSVINGSKQTVLMTYCPQGRRRTSG